MKKTFGNFVQVRIANFTSSAKCFSMGIIAVKISAFGAVGRVLSQIRNGKKHPVAHCSRALTKCKQNYSTTRRKEVLAVVHALKKFRCYLDQAFLQRTDHAILR